MIAGTLTFKKCSRLQSASDYAIFIQKIEFLGGEEAVPLLQTLSRTHLIGACSAQPLAPFSEILNTPLPSHVVTLWCGPCWDNCFPKLISCRPTFAIYYAWCELPHCISRFPRIILSELMSLLFQMNILVSRKKHQKPKWLPADYQTYFLGLEYTNNVKRPGLHPELTGDAYSSLTRILTGLGGHFPVERWKGGLEKGEDKGKSGKEREKTQKRGVDCPPKERAGCPLKSASP